LYTAGVAGERFFQTLRSRGVLAVTRCAECQVTYLPPRLYCERCFADLSQAWAEVAPGGRVHTYTVVCEDQDGHPLDPPQVVAFVRIDGTDGGLIGRLLRIRLQDVRVEMPVDAVLAPPRRRRGRMDDIVGFSPRRALRRQVPAVTPPPFPLVRDRIFPLLKRTAALPPEAGYVRGNRIVRRPLDDQISVAYVIEGQHRMTLVTDAMPESWQVTTDHLHRLAVDNLQTRTRHILDEIAGSRTEYVSLDGFDAARLLVAGLIIPPGMADPLLAIPHEHACLIAPATEIDRLAAKADELFTSAQSPLTPRLYRVGPDGPVPTE